MSSWVSLSASVFRWASVVLPYHGDVTQSPRNGVIGGASLWTLTARNRTAEEYRGVAEFYRFISEVEQDKWWHHVTGYVPLTLAAYEASRAEGFYTQNPGADAAICLHGDAATEIVGHQRLLGFGETYFPRRTCVCQ